MRALTAALGILVVVQLVATGAAEPPHVTVFSLEGSLQTAVCVQTPARAGCDTLLPGSRVVIPLDNLDAPGTPFHWSGNISWGGLPTSDTFQATLVATIDGLSTTLHESSGPTPVAFHYDLAALDASGATGYTLHIHGLKTYAEAPVGLALEHRQTFFVDGVVLSA